MFVARGKLGDGIVCSWVGVLVEDVWGGGGKGRGWEGYR